MFKPHLLRCLTLLCYLRVFFGSLPGDANKPDKVLIHENNNVVEIVQCRMCHLQFPGEKCSRGRGICTATVEEACMAGKIFKKDGTMWLKFMGCLKNCANVKKIKWGSYLVDFRCCRGHDMCNERF
ncbi:prostate and testis expressed protein 1 precursor [Rattus norvegicus]|uniref:Prostate and testis expressed 1 n=1 Tax=Rattus norvegicus TaxID=10116 RepID=H8Y6J3_RAT|nr:prostate and testis expressed protein 1 precursor [Rattus norvegicus]AEZ68747.1 prostate and testis expressed protein [Rattus norvegicus]|eukprot:NP_001257318.1 prostate and testis expressed protein 1 precursor [Rattus norvegicus]